jgi:manganese/zinc/iron transport system permease protein
MTLTDLSIVDFWIILAAALCGVACALLGNFLVLRKMSMMGDAISHAVLPGLAVAFLLTGSVASVPMFVGAAVVGVLTALFTEWVHSAGKVDEGASMGVVFTGLFALGLLLIVQAADHVDLDPSCVLYGAVELTPLDTVTVFGYEITRAVAMLSVVLLLDALVVLLFYKELKISSFDPNLATTLGINARFMHYLLMTMVAVTTVASFEAVGSILVVAMLIVPPATAHLLTDRLGVMVVLSVVLAAASAVLGHLGAIWVPAVFGFGSTTTAGMMAVAAGLLFGLAVLLAPRYGVASKLLHRASLSLRILREDVLGILARAEEQAGEQAVSDRPVERVASVPATLAAEDLREATLAGPVSLRGATWSVPTGCGRHTWRGT